MPRPKKNYQPLNIKLDSTIMERFKIYCDIMGQTETTALERILQKHLDAFEHGEMGNIPNAVTFAAMSDAVNGKDLHGQYNNVSDVFDALNK